MFLILVQLVFGGFLLVVGGEFVVRGASHLALAAKLSPLFVGLTVVSFGTSAPELAVSVLTALEGQADITVGNVIGSNLFNLLVIVGVAAMVVPLEVRRQVVRFDLPVMILAAVLMYVLSIDTVISLIDGVVLIAVLMAYFAISFRLGRLQFKSDAAAAGPDIDLVVPPLGSPWRSVLINTVILIAGIGLLIFGCQVFVDASVSIAQRLGMSEALIGLTIVSIGTSLPELVTSVMASLKGQRSIAIGNAVGSTTLNVLAVLGITSIVASTGITVAEKLFQSDLPLMIACCVLVWPIFATGRVVSRAEGTVLVVVYTVYLVFLVRSAAGG